MANAADQLRRVVKGGEKKRERKGFRLSRVPCNYGKPNEPPVGGEKKKRGGRGKRESLFVFKHCAGSRGGRTGEGGGSRWSVLGVVVIDHRMGSRGGREKNLPFPMRLDGKKKGLIYGAHCNTYGPVAKRRKKRRGKKKKKRPPVTTSLGDRPITAEAELGRKGGKKEKTGRPNHFKFHFAYRTSKKKKKEKVTKPSKCLVSNLGRGEKEGKASLKEIVGSAGGGREKNEKNLVGPFLAIFATIPVSYAELGGEAKEEKKKEGATGAPHRLLP